MVKGRREGGREGGRDRMKTKTYLEHISIHQPVSEAPVKRDPSVRSHVLWHAQRNHGGIREDQRTEGEGVRADGGEEQCLDSWVHHTTTG